MEATLDSVGVDDVEGFVHEDSSTSLFGVVVCLLFGLHVLFAEVRLKLLEVWGVEFQKLREELTFGLKMNVVKGVSVDEEALLASVSVQVKEEIDCAHALDQLSDSPDGGLFVGSAVVVHSV